MATKVYGSEVRAITLKGMEIKYELTRKSVKNVNLRIDASGNVKVSAARSVSVDYIEKFMYQKQELNITAVEKAKENSLSREKEQTQRLYRNGERLTILGSKLEVSVIESREERIYPDNGYLYFFVRNPDDSRHRELMYEKWLKSYQYGVFEEICRRIYRIFKQYKVEYPVI